MKHFDRDGKDNFVDVNNVFVGFDNNSKCCEEFGWFISKEIPTMIDDGLYIPTDGYVFDVGFIQEVSFDEKHGNGSSGVVFRLTKGDDVIYLTLHNTHNGYYYHGFNMVVGGRVVESGSL